MSNYVHVNFEREKKNVNMERSGEEFAIFLWNV
jgi:hypothetical protein